MKRVEFWFDFSCPYAYLGSTQIEALCQRTGAELVPEPMLLGGVFRAWDTPQNLSEVLAADEARHNLNDMHRWAERFGVPLSMPAGHPYRTVTALRAMLAHGPPFMPLAHRFFRAYWVDGVDLSSDENVRAVLVQAGLDAERLLQEARSATVKDDLRRRTDRAIELGIFGAPSMVVGSDLYWGQDKLEQVEQALGGAADAAPPVCDHPVELYVNPDDPFSYVAAQIVERYFSDIEWVPVVLPRPRFHAAKARYRVADLVRQARVHGLPFAFPRKHQSDPALAASALGRVPAAERGAAIRAVLSARFERGLDIADRAVLEGLGLDVEARASGEYEARASAAGVFQTPTLVVRSPDRAPALYWGSDRLELAAERARGGG